MNKFEALESEIEKIKAGDASYVERNRGFITASKLKCYSEDPFTYKLKYVDEIPEPYYTEKDYFVVGQALDDLLTYGAEYFSQHYISVDTRINDIDDKIVAVQKKIVDAQNDLKKDGSRSNMGLKNEEKYIIKLNSLKELKQKIQLTNKQAEIINAMQFEFSQQKMFSHTPKKKVFIVEYKNHKIKVELDDYRPKDKEIRDIKTCANILNIDPEFYLIQAVLYDLVVELRTGERHNVYFEFVDKVLPSRSKMIHYHQDTLQSNRYIIYNLLDSIIESHELDLFIPTSNQEQLYRSPYYGYEGYGRPNAPIIY